MSFPDGPVEAEQAHEEMNAVDPAPTDGPLAMVTRRIRRHFDMWARRYVEMRVGARAGRP